jgi:hypothetical protein
MRPAGRITECEGRQPRVGSEEKEARTKLVVVSEAVAGTEVGQD